MFETYGKKDNLKVEVKTYDDKNKGGAIELLPEIKEGSEDDEQIAKWDPYFKKRSSMPHHYAHLFFDTKHGVKFNLVDATTDGAYEVSKRNRLEIVFSHQDNTINLLKN